MTARPSSPLLPLVAALLPSLLLAACGGEAAPPTLSPAELDQVWRGEGDAIVVRVDDLHCTGCEAAVKRSFGAVAGVAAVEADNETDIVRVRLEDPALRYDLITQLDRALHDLGKKAVPPAAEAPAE